MDLEHKALDYVNGHLSSEEREKMERMRTSNPELDRLIRDLETEITWVRTQTLDGVAAAPSKRPFTRFLPHAVTTAACLLIWLFLMKKADPQPKICLVLQTENPKVQVYLVENLPNELWESP